MPLPQALPPSVAALLLAGVVAATCGAAELPPLALVPVVSGLASPVAVTHAGDERLFVTLQGGRVVVVADGRLLPRPFLDLSSRVAAGGERGLLSTAFHPRYRDNGLFFVDYTDLAGDTVVARYRVSADPGRADPASAAVLLHVDQPFANHNGGQLQLGPDGKLYVGMGDGGSANDPACNAQRGDSLLGKILRLDVDRGADLPPFHSIPADNPFRGPGPPRDEIWALGLRNPWRFSFDRGTGDLFIADVGQGSREEIDLLPAGGPGGADFGWNVVEGSLCTGRDAACPAATPPCGDPRLLPPIVEYGHQDRNCAVVGGYVYRGEAIPEATGLYFYGDFCSGTLWAAERQGNRWVSQRLPLNAPGLTSFGEDVRGELYLTTLSGTLYRLERAAGAPPPAPCSPASSRLCLGAGRFRLEAAWRGPGGTGGTGTAVPLTDDAGYFWFFDPVNVELVVKVLDACAPPFDRFWVFAAGLTDVGVDLTVVDTESGRSHVYRNPIGTAFTSIQDTTTFDTCP